MEFLYCDPSVMVVRNSYDIIVNTLEEGVCYVKVGRKTYHENNSGIMPSVTLVHKFRVPQKVLDEKKEYTVFYKAVYDRKTNFPEVGKLLKKKYTFRPIEKSDDVKVFYTADIHCFWEEAEKCALGAGKIDMYIVNGDFGESSSYDNLRMLNRLIGNVTKGEIPSLVGRGNHDTRGKLAEKVTDYMATYDGHAYFDFSVGPIAGVIFDCGEDKYDNHPEYRSLNFFERYRKDELKFMRKVKLADKPFKFAVCHIPFMSTTAMSGQFDIMGDLYKEWGKTVDKMGVEFMICGHTHRIDYIPDGDKKDKFPHAYPVIVGSELRTDPTLLIGTLVTLSKKGSVATFISHDGKVVRKISIADGKKID